MGERCFWYQPGIYSVQPVCWLELGPILVHVSVPIGLQREALATALTLLLVIEAQLTWIQNFNNTFFQCSFEILSTLFIANVIHNSLPPLCYGWNQACRIAIFSSQKLLQNWVSSSLLFMHSSKKSITTLRFTCPTVLFFHPIVLPATCMSTLTTISAFVNTFLRSLNLASIVFVISDTFVI